MADSKTVAADEVWDLFESRRFLHGHRETQKESFMVVLASLSPPIDEGKPDRIMADPCVQKLADDEPFFVLLGRDNHASHALATWINYRIKAEGRSEKTAAAEKTLDAFCDYQDARAALSKATGA